MQKKIDGSEDNKVIFVACLFMGLLRYLTLLTEDVLPQISSKMGDWLNQNPVPDRVLTFDSLVSQNFPLLNILRLLIFNGYITRERCINNYKV